MSTTRYAGLLTAGLIAACGGGGRSQNPEVPIEPRRTPVEQLALKTFAADCSDFLDYAADALTEQYLTPVFCLAIGPCPVFADAGPPPPGAPMPTPAPTPGVVVSAPPPADAPEPERVSGTNTQEAGVDEADIVKVDAAGRLYILDDNRLLILPAFPPDGLAERPLAALALSDERRFFYAFDFFLDEDAQRAVVLGSSYDGTVQAVAVIVDVSDPAAPQELRRLVVDGSPLASRRIDGRVHRVSRFDVPAPAWFYDADDPLMALRDDYYEAQGNGDEDAAEAIKAQIRAEIGNRVAAAGADPYLPHRRVVEGDSVTSDTPLACDAISRPDVTTALGLAVVDSFDTDGGNSATSAIV
ncbi:MAG: beta-propeller domain-containing protein, partial [Gammaproteobacteria bacterium]